MHGDWIHINVFQLFDSRMESLHSLAASHSTELTSGSKTLELFFAFNACWIQTWVGSSRIEKFRRENKWSVLNPETNDATRIHPLENSVFCAIKSERCCESWKMFILTASHSIIIESCVNRLFSLVRASNRLQTQSLWVQLTIRRNLLPSAGAVQSA